MERRDIQAEKSHNEQECPRVFLDWFGKTQGTAYSIRRTEEVFPDLVGETRWDFVARRSDHPDWIALEVKEVTVDKYHIVLQFWDTVFQQVNQQLRGRLKGTYSIVGPPDLNVRQKRRKELAEAISAAILDKSCAIVSGTYIDIWPDVAARLVNWPPDITSSLVSYVTPGETRPATMYIQRFSDIGAEVHIALYSSPPVAEAAERQAVADLLASKDGAVKFNSQMKVARDRGARLGIVLLDTVIWGPKDITSMRQTLRTQQSGLMSSTDAIYVVDVSHSKVVKIWP